MLDEKLKDLKDLIPDFEEIDLTKEEILKKSKKDSKDRNFSFNIRKLSLVISTFVIILLLGISSIFVYNYIGNQSLNKNKEMLKNELNQIVENMDESTVIQNNKDYINDVIDKNIDAINKNTPSAEVEDIYTNTLDDILNSIITEDASIDLLDQLFASGKLYYDEFIGNGGPTIEAKPNYSDLKDYRNSFRFYGSYNGASVLFVLEKEKTEMNINILEFSFYHSTHFDIFVTKDEITYELSDKNDLEYVLQNEILIKKDIEKIYQIHTTWVDE